MIVKVKLRYIILAIAIVIASIWALKYISDTKHQLEVDSLSTELYGANMKVSEYVIEVNGLQETVAETNTIILSRDNEIFDLKEDKERLRALNIKQVDMIGRLEARIRVIIDSIPPSTPVVIIEKPDGVYAKLPLSYSFKDAYAHMDTDIGLNGKAKMGFGIDSLSINIVVGGQGQGFFKKNKPITAVTTDNPYLSISKSNVALVQNQVSPYVYVGVGAGGVLCLALLVNLLK